MRSDYDLDGKRMNAVQTAPNGVIDAETIFQFHQSGDRVWADYAGGRIERGYLVGRVTGRQFEFRYCQMQTDGVQDSGHSRCELRVEGGLLQIVEHFEWGSRPGGGVNVIQEMC